ncbi:MAG TPA: hypothetical protein VLW85_10325 [Myxococcales bacterium]|nr:hypothetical protein [Myxococcales bacterium]
MDVEEKTAAGSMRCSCCGARHAQRTGWRQKSLYILADPGALYAYICGRCAARFSSERAADEFLETELGSLALRYTRRLAAC